MQVLVIGAGIGGLATALALHRADFYGYETAARRLKQDAA
jgi:2-polyprenyl-6-methoxyphenol hydroxylase-like FAD-dependent oxidoreductase